MQVHAHLKHVLSVVIREHQETKKQLNGARWLVSSRDSEITKLKAQTNHMKIKLDELFLLSKRRLASTATNKTETIEDLLQA